MTKKAGGCSCHVPDHVSSEVRASRASAIAIILVHACALVAFGWASAHMWLASLVAFIICPIHLCMFNKISYATAGSFYIVGLLFDLGGVAAWIAFEADYAEDVEGYFDNDIFGDWDDWKHPEWLALPPAIGALAYLIGLSYTFMAVCKWHLSGAPDVVRAQAPGSSV